MMSIFEDFKAAASQSHDDTLAKLRETLDRLEAEREETPQIASLKRVLSARIQEIESKTA